MMTRAPVFLEVSGGLCVTFRGGRPPKAADPARDRTIVGAVRGPPRPLVVAGIDTSKTEVFEPVQVTAPAGRASANFQ
jgi:hypothetical protein